MRGVNKYLMTLIATSLFALPAVAASQDQNWTLNLYLENDIFSNRDEGYTSGLRAARYRTRGLVLRRPWSQAVLMTDTSMYRPKRLPFSSR